MSVTITTAIQTYGIWPLPQNFRVYAEFREILWKHGNSAATAKFRGSARNSAARGKLWALVITFFHLSSSTTCMPNFIEIKKTFCGQTDTRTDGNLPLIVLGRLPKFGSRPKN